MLPRIDIEFLFFSGNRYIYVCEYELYSNKASSETVTASLVLIPWCRLLITI